jgi:hypothetical protein
MIRGHWRHAGPGRTDQRVPWSNPYWEGPDMPAVVERLPLEALARDS